MADDPLTVRWATADGKYPKIGDRVWWRWSDKPFKVASRLNAIPEAGGASEPIVECFMNHEDAVKSRDAMTGGK